MENIREEIKTRYGAIAKNVSENAQSSCGCGGAAASCSSAEPESDLYTAEQIKGLPLEAVTASLGCANPIALANLQKGEAVLDLGSGGGIDVLISAKYVGETGKVYGLDMTDEMLELANQNKKKSGFKNVEFLKGYIEDIPLPDGAVDVITSNCVINLSESKASVLKEAYRVLKKGGRLAVADIVEMKQLPAEVKESIAGWIGCVSGALSVDLYKQYLREAGFTNIEVIPANIYTKDMIKSLAEDNNLGELYAQLDVDALDGAFASAFVKAVK